MRRVILALGLAGLACSATACGGTDPELARRGAIVSSLIDADEVQLRARPQLMAGKYAHMAGDLFSFYRGTFFLFLRDSRDGSSPVGRFDYATDVQPYALGDAHLENFGLLHGRDDELTLEPNDLDASDRWPYQIDLRRLSVSLLLGARLSQPDRSEDDERAIVRAVLESYEARVKACAERREPEPEAPDEGSPHLADLLKRARRDGPTRVELETLTKVEDGKRTFLRGSVDPEDPQSVLADLPDRATRAFPETLAQYTKTLHDPPEPAFFEPLDAVREFGSGVASWPRVRTMVLVRGPSDAVEDDVILEVKEQLDSGARSVIGPGRFFDDLTDRVDTIRDAAWSRPGADPFWGMGQWVGFRVQIRSETEWNKNLRTSRFEDERAETAGLVDLATRLGRRVGNLHSASIGTVRPCEAIADRLGSRMIDSEIEVARAYATQVQFDYALFQRALEARGPLLGYPRQAAEGSSRELSDLFNTGMP